MVGAGKVERCPGRKEDARPTIWQPPINSAPRLVKHDREGLRCWPAPPEHVVAAVEDAKRERLCRLVSRPIKDKRESRAGLVRVAVEDAQDIACARADTGRCHKQCAGGEGTLGHP